MAAPCDKRRVAHPCIGPAPVLLILLYSSRKLFILNLVKPLISRFTKISFVNSNHSYLQCDVSTRLLVSCITNTIRKGTCNIIVNLLTAKASRPIINKIIINYLQLLTQRRITEQIMSQRKQSIQCHPKSPSCYHCFPRRAQ